MNNTKMIELLIKAQDNPTIENRKAFVAVCYDQYFTTLFLIARALSRDLAEAEDKIQDFFMEKLLMSNCIQHLPRENGKFDAFLKVIFRNYLRTKWRKEKHYVHIHQHLEDSEWNALNENPQQDIYVDWSSQLEHYTKKLPATYQKLLRLKMEKKSNQEIAQLTGRTLDSVKSTYSRIKNKLRVIANNQSKEWMQRA